MIGTYDYVLYSNDLDFLSSYWSKYELAMTFITAKLDSTGMLDVTGTNDWGRLTQGGHNTEANMLMYRTLITGSTLATWANQTSLSASWAALASTLQASVYNHNFDTSVG